MRDFIAALQFLTTLKIAKQEVRSTEEFARSMFYFPVVGLLLGAILAGIGYVATLKLLPGVVGAVLLVAEIVLTGGLHLDGYMDTMDGLFSGRSRERILEIMKDSRVGAHAVIALGGLFVLKYALLVQIAALGEWRLLILMPAVARFNMCIGPSLFAYARPDGLGKGFAQFFRLRYLLLTALYTLVAAGLLLSWRGIIIFAITTLWSVVFASFVARRLGGLTGDVYGALSELGELVVLLTAVLIG
ncbi:MAG: adenosylcobinamide-GDP ribazoletransferase [Peptococcaceae bacterium]|nr:adenosylcobinamide-GDP ribazoletransferase [Peptococcaceae bacterium]